MAFLRDFDYTIDGTTVIYQTRKSVSAASLPSNQGLLVKFSPIKGTLVIKVRAWNLLTPTQTQGKGANTLTQYNFVPLKIEVFGPGKSLRETRTVPAGWSNDQDFSFKHDDFGSSNEAGDWEVHATNTGPDTAEAQLSVAYVFSRQPLLTARLPLFLLDHTYSVILDALTPAAKLTDNSVLITFGEELSRFFAGSPPAALKPVVYPLPLGIKGTGSLKNLEMEACSGKQLLAAMRAQYQKLAASYAQQLVGDSGNVAILVKVNENNQWKARWEKQVADDWIVIHFTAAFTDLELDRDVDLIIPVLDADIATIQVDIADIRQATVEVYLAFDSVFIQCYALVLTPAEITGGLLGVAKSLGFIPELNALAESMLTVPLQDAVGPRGRYLGEALGRLCGQKAVFLGVKADDSAWTVQYTALPLVGIGGAPGHTDAGDKITGAATGTGGATTSGGATTIGGTGDKSAGVTTGTGGDTTSEGPTSSGDAVNSRSAPSRADLQGLHTGTSVGIPPEFVIGPPAALASLDHIENIVVVMMENRSFDHMLGYLPHVNGVKGAWSNPLAGQTKPVLLRKASDIVLPPVTQIRDGPDHGFTAVTGRDSKDGAPIASMNGGQIADGAMSGFAQNYDNLYPGKGEMVMTYYTGAELTMYDLLAGQFAVCDHWFAAHPGPTWPNRWTTLSGSTPELENPPNSDDRLGFLPQFTIFDVLTSHGIGWNVFESDLSLIRTYNQYRLDSTHVIPLRNRHDKSQWFETVAKAGKLPPVVFVEPNFSDIPPLSSANDDLVPVDVRRGQEFVSRVCDALVGAPQWPNMLLLIVYDEHGGFFDHVAPPGTRLGPPQFYDKNSKAGKIPRIHPHGADHLGVRVPAIVVSPWVSPRSVCSQIFDHTSIIKTILLRHRGAFEPNFFTLFGPRVSQANHLGLALDMDAGRLETPVLARIERSAQPREAFLPRRRKGLTLHDLHESLPKAFLPRPPH